MIYICRGRNFSYNLIEIKGFINNELKCNAVNYFRLRNTRMLLYNYKL